MRRIASTVGICLLAIALASCTAGGAEDTPGESGHESGGCDPSADDENGTWSVDEAKQFCKFTLYWLGEEYGGLLLTRIERYRTKALPSGVPSYEAEDGVHFIYGSCEPNGDSSCPLPLSVTIEPYCSRPPTI